MIFKFLPRCIASEEQCSDHVFGPRGIQSQWPSQIEIKNLKQLTITYRMSFYLVQQVNIFFEQSKPNFIILNFHFAAPLHPVAHVDCAIRPPSLPSYRAATEETLHSPLVCIMLSFAQSKFSRARNFVKFPRVELHKT